MKQWLLRLINKDIGSPLFSAGKEVRLKYRKPLVQNKLLLHKYDLRLIICYESCNRNKFVPA